MSGTPRPCSSRPRSDVTAALAAPTVLLAGVLLATGLAVGSFLNVVVHRVPAGVSLVAPGSACPACSSPVRAFDNVPVLSWLLLRGRCRDCAAPISWRYPLVEAATGLLFLAAGLRFGLSPYLAGALALLAAGIALALIDLAHQRLPFAITAVTGALVTAALVADLMLGRLSAGTGGSAVAAGGLWLLGTALISAVLWLAVYGGIWLATAGRGMGLGDVALAPVLGLLLGWQGWGPSLVGLLGGFAIGAVVGVVLLLLGRAGRRSRVPHGPFMLAGGFLGLFAGAPLWSAYLGLVGLG
jgi:leader peptidase (prepilin peptidase)/N-methyltransferase